MDAIWTTRDGTKIPVRDMTDSHLLNTIRMLRRSGANENGGDSTYTIGGDTEYVETGEIDDMLRSMLDEADRRALSTDSHV